MITLSWCVSNCLQPGKAKNILLSGWEAKRISERPAIRIWSQLTSTSGCLFPDFLLYEIIKKVLLHKSPLGIPVAAEHILTVAVFLS